MLMSIVRKLKLHSELTDYIYLDQIEKFPWLKEQSEKDTGVKLVYSKLFDAKPKYETEAYCNLDGFGNWRRVKINEL